MDQSIEPDLVLETLIETAKEMNAEISDQFIKATYTLFAGYQFSENELEKVTDHLRDLLQKEIATEITK